MERSNKDAQLIHREFQKSVNGDVGALDLQQVQPTPKQDMCEHMADAGGCKGKDAGVASSRFLNHDVYNTKLEIGFPKSSEDHRLQLVEINGSVFAIVHSPLESNGPIQLYCEEWSLVILAPIKSKSNIVISAINIIFLNQVESEEGIVNIHASNKLVKFTHLMKPPEKVYEIAQGGEFQFDDDPGAFLYYHRLFESILSSVHKGSADSLLEAQQKFIASLCTLAEKIKGKTESLNLSRVLDIWSIPSLKS